MRMKVLVAGTLLAASVVAGGQTPANAAGGGRLTSAGTVSVSALSPIVGSDAIGTPELPQSEGDQGNGNGNGNVNGKKVDSAHVAGPGAEMSLTFAGLNHRDQRLAFAGNQFSLEPPDQALCVGPNAVLEGVNDALRVFDKTGAPLTGTLSLNEFFNYAPAINRTTGVFGSEITDPVCHFDAATGRFFFAVLTLDQDATTGALTGKNRIDLAVSATSDPTGTWTRYKLAVQDDGTEGTPNHHCAPDPAPPAERTNPSACIGDYPHIGADQYGVYVTTNEYSFFGEDTTNGVLYAGSQIYAFSKAQLAAGNPSPSMQQFAGPKLGQFNSFTVIPAISPAGQFNTADNGTEYMLSSTLGDGSETGNTATSENRIGVWSLTNTQSLDSSSPSIVLQNRLIKADTYSLPPKATQKSGSSPLRDCLNDTSSMFGPGIGCWGLFLGAPPAAPEAPSVLDASDTRMQQVVFANGRLWGALGTAVKVGGKSGTTARAGVLWMSVKVNKDNGRLNAETKDSGYVAIGGNDVIYPALGVSSSGAVVMAATVTGTDHYPSASYTILNHGRPTVHIVSEGVGPDDGFSGTQSLGGGRPRWGDYGAVAMDGGTLWLASESIEQTCTLAQYLSGAIGSCGGTRTALANWGTRITAVQV